MTRRASEASRLIMSSIILKTQMNCKVTDMSTLKPSPTVEGQGITLRVSLRARRSAGVNCAEQSRELCAQRRDCFVATLLARTPKFKLIHYPSRRSEGGISRAPDERCPVRGRARHQGKFQIAGGLSNFAVQ